MDDLRTLVHDEMARAGSPSYSFIDLDRRRDRKRRHQRTSAGVVGIAVFMAAVWGVTTAGSFDRTRTPADQPTVNQDAAAVEVALGFLDAYAAFDAQKAMTYVADDADLRSFLGVSQRFPTNTEGLSLKLRLELAAGYEQTVTSCEATPVGDETSVVCDFVFHALGSDQIGRGPFSGRSFVFTVRDGAIVRAGVARDLARFERQMWEPFAEWVSSTYPKDTAVMYLDGTLEPRFSLESIRLWEQHLRDYVKGVQQGTEVTP